MLGAELCAQAQFTQLGSDTYTAISISNKYQQPSTRANTAIPWRDGTVLHVTTRVFEISSI